MIDVKLVLEKLSQINLIRLHKISGDYYTIYCPFHNGGQERKPSFGVLLKEQYRNGRKYPEGFAHCFTCGYAATLDKFISDLLNEHNISQTGLEWLELNIPNFQRTSDYELLIPDNLVTSVSNTFALDYLKKLSKPEKTYITEEELQCYRYTVPYMYERRLTDEVIEKYDIGYDANWTPRGRKTPTPCLTFPVADKDGNVVFIYRRSIEGKFFFAPKDVEKPVYGLDKLPQGCKSICICESILNALTAITYGYNAVALLGTGTPYQMKQLQSLGVSEYILCLDGDEAGRRGTNRLKRSLSGSGLVWVVPIPEGKDLNDLDKETFDKLYSERE